jgi:hypothetical protein
MNKVAKIVKSAAVVDARGDTDTFRLWENYKDQALLWRSIALLQLPTTGIAIILSMFLWHTRKVTLNVPRQPMPGLYNAEEIPNEVFTEFATDFVNLIATYQSAVARPQFLKAREMMNAKMLQQFDEQMMNDELKAIENTSRTQIFFVDPTKTKVTRDKDNPSFVTIDLVGERLKVVAGKELPTVKTKFSVTLTTIPRNALNAYGLIVTNLAAEAYKPI